MANWGLNTLMFPCWGPISMLVEMGRYSLSVVQNDEPQQEISNMRLDDWRITDYEYIDQPAINKLPADNMLPNK